MTTKIICDGGCGQYSPNEHGLHVANKWRRMKVKWTWYFENEKDYIVCCDCWNDMVKALPEGKRLRKARRGIT